MKNIELLSQILKRTNKLIVSDEYKQQYRAKHQNVFLTALSCQGTLVTF